MFLSAQAKSPGARKKTGSLLNQARLVAKISTIKEAGMVYENYSRVRLVTDKYENEGVSTGAIGVIIEIHGNGQAYELEFSDPDGITIAQIVAKQEDIELHTS
jgi:hypothetical protein